MEDLLHVSTTTPRSIQQWSANRLVDYAQDQENKKKSPEMKTKESNQDIDNNLLDDITPGGGLRDPFAKLDMALP